MAWTIVSRAEVADLTAINETDLRDSWYDMVVGLLKKESGYEYIDGTQAISDEAHDGDGTDMLRVKYPPIVSVSSLTIDDTSVASSRYKVYGNYIRLVSDIDDTIPDYFPVGTQNVTISYTGGFTETPEELKLAIVNAIGVVGQYQRRGATMVTPKYTTPDRSEPAPEPMIPSVNLVSVVRNILRNGLPARKLRFD